MTHWKQKLLWQNLTTMVIDKIRKMTVKGLKLKSESFFLVSPGVLELWRKNLKGGGFRPPGMDRVNCVFLSFAETACIMLFQRFSCFVKLKILSLLYTSLI